MPAEVLVEGRDGTPIEIVGVSGARGRDGAAGADGAPGPPGSTTNTGGAYHHSQDLPSDHWHIIHGLDFTPNWTIIDSGGSRAWGEEVNTPGVTDIYFSAAFGGDGYGS